MSNKNMPALPETRYNGYGDGSEPLYTAEQMCNYARDYARNHTTDVLSGGLKVGNLLTLNQEPYPGLGEWFVQIWSGEEVVARVYGDSREQCVQRAKEMYDR